MPPRDAALRRFRRFGAEQAVYSLNPIHGPKAPTSFCRYVLHGRLSILPPALAQHVGAPTDDLTNVGVDELFSVQVTSVGRKAQKLSKSSASVFVLTSEDIRRCGE